MDIFYTNSNNFEGKNNYYKGHFAARAIIEYCAKNIYNIENPELEIVNNKPKFKYSDINFSISHSGEIAAVCFDKNPVGFDIEKIKNRNYKSIAKRMNFSLEEDSLEAFYKCWTQYEAAFKLQNEVKYRFSEKLSANYVFSIASIQKINPESIQELFL